MTRAPRLFLICLCLGAIWSSAATVRAQAPDGRAHHAAVVVQFGDGQVASRCVGFDEPSITGADLMARAGFSVIGEQAGGMGSLVCSIDGVGCDYPNEPCACRCQGSDCTYWAYSHLIDGAWRYSVLGASSYTITDGAVDGWAWGSGSVQRGATPPMIDFGAVCDAQAAPVPTAVPSVPPTAQSSAAGSPAISPETPTSPIQATTTRAPTPMVAAPTVTSPTALPMSTSTSPIAGDGSVAPTPRATGWANYAVFAALLAILGAGIFMVRRRQP